MSSTADRWFVSNQEFDTSKMDYAIVNQDASQIRHMTVMQHSHISQADIEKVDFRDALYFARRTPHYPYAYCGVLLYADVDEENPKHKEQVVSIWATEDFLDKESEEAENAKKKLSEHLTVHCYDEDIDEEICFHGNLDPTLTNYILSAKSKEEKELLLSIISGQGRRKTQRPVLMLVGVAEDMRNSKLGETEGWVVGYDFVKNLLIIKPFISNQDHHIFGGKWDMPVANDGVSFSGPPEAFASQYIESAEKTALAKTVEAGFQMLAHTIAVKWMLARWTGFAASSPSFLTEALATDLRTAAKTLKETMQEIPLPIANKGIYPPAATATPRTDLARVVQRLLVGLELLEWEMRDAAVRTRDRGHVDVAMEAAGLYESLGGLLRGFGRGGEKEGEGV